MKKQRWEESEKIREEKKPQEDAGAPKDRKVAKDCFFPMTYGAGGSKSRLTKAAVRSHLAR